jgi:DNA adenine methylase
MKPPLRWVGRKSHLADIIVSLMPKSFNHYYEPFLGSGAIFLRVLSEKRASKYILSDINPHLITMWISIQKDVDNLCSHLVNLKQSYEQSNDKKGIYCQWRELLTNTSGTEQASLFLILNRTCFNALVRYNKQGKFNSAFGYRETFGLDIENLITLNATMSETEVVFSQKSFECAVEGCIEGDVVYFDPPYFEEYRKMDSLNYSTQRFGLNQHDRLINEIRLLDKKGSKFILSNNDCQYVNERLGGFSKIALTTRKQFTSDPSDRVVNGEVLIHNCSVEI